MFDDSCAFLKGASVLRPNKGRSCQKFEFVDEFELQEAEAYYFFTLLYVLSENGTVPMQPCIRSPLTKVKFQRQLREGFGEHI